MFTYYIGKIGTNTFIVVPSHTTYIVEIYYMKTIYIIVRDSPALKIGAIGWGIVNIIIVHFSIFGNIVETGIIMTMLFTCKL